MNNKNIEKTDRDLNYSGAFMDFVLLNCGDFCVFVTRRHFQILVNYYFALENAKSWDDFWLVGGPALSQFCEVFLEIDEYEPKGSDLLDVIQDDVWILQNDDFPDSQCAEETTTEFGHLFPKEYCIGKIWTEYGSVIDLFTAENCSGLLESANSLGINVGMIYSPFPMILHDYS